MSQPMEQADPAQLQSAIAALESQRGVLGDAVVELAVSPLRAKLAAMSPAPQAGAEGPQQTIKQATILFLDVVGSTSMSQQLDPEEISAILDGALQRFAGILASRRGRVLKYMGDGLLCAFGADEVREDDAEQGVQAGLELLAEARRYSNEMAQKHGILGFDIRIGVHTGPVLMGGGVDAEGSIRGMSVNVAARMEQTAPPGTLRITHDTYVHVRGMFDVDPQDPMAVKGVDEPVQSYLVRSAKPRSFRIVTRGIEGVPTRMVGRDREFGELQAAFERLFRRRGLEVVAVAGEAGVGKSRILHEFESWAEARPESFYIFRGRATPHTLNQPFGLLRDIIAWRFQIADDDSVESARAKLQDALVPLFAPTDGPELAEGHAHILGHLIGIDHRESRHLRGIANDARQVRTRGLHAAAQLFRRMSATDGAPVVLLLEDLHWADRESLDFLASLAGVNGDVPMLVLGSTRPSLFERQAAWDDIAASGAETYSRIDLRLLDASASRQLAGELLQKLGEIPSVLRELIAERAAGNPFYMEELVRMLVDQGAISTQGDTWSVDPAKLLATQVPATLIGILQARLDGLPADERRTLQAASVIGHVFWDKPLFALDARASEALPALTRRELAVRRDDVAATELKEFAFTHQILHQVTYDTVLKRARRELHGRLARWFSSLEGLRSEDFLGVTAEHYELAGDPANAVEYHVRAAEHASARFAHEAMLAHAQRALTLLDQLGRQDAEVDAMRWRILNLREKTLDLRGMRAEQRLDIEALARLAEQLQDDRRRGHVAHLRANLAMRIASWPECEEAANRGAALCRAAGEAETRLSCQRLAAVAMVHGGDWKAAEQLALDTLAEARTLALLDVQSNCLNTLGLIATQMRGDPLAGLMYDQQTLQIDRAAGNRRTEAIALLNVGVGWLALGNLAGAQEHLEPALDLIRAQGNRAMESAALCELAILAIRQGQPGKARQLAHEASAVASAAEARDIEVQTLIIRGEAALEMGDFGNASIDFQRAHELAVAIDHTFRHDALAGHARAALAVGDVAAARRDIESVVTQWGDDGEGVLDARMVELACYRVLSQANDPRARSWLERAHSRLQATAGAITDAVQREEFVNRIPHHREIAALWSERGSRSANMAS